nr:hypothetical protein [Tanacetum cinerariifolium]
MSDVDHFVVTYTSISSDDGSSDVGSLRVIVLGYDGLTMMPEDPYAYVEAAMQEPPPPDFISEPVYPEFMPPEDDVLPAEEQPLHAAVSPTADSPCCITKSNTEEDPKEDDDKDPEAAMTRLRTESPSTSHQLPPPIVLPHTRASMVMMRSAAPSTYILAPRSKTPPSGTPPVLPIPLPTSSPPFLLPSTNCIVDVLEVTLPPRKSLCIDIGPRFKIEECSSALTARPTRGFSANYGFVSTLDVEIRRDPDREIDYGITDVWEDPDEIAEEIPTTDVAELSQRMTDFVTTVRQDTDKIYGRLDNAPDDRLLMSGQLNSLRRDRRSHARTARLMKSEARASREAWVQSMDTSDTVRSEVRALQTMVLAQQTKHVTLTEARMAMTAIIRERVVEGQNKLLKSHVKTVGQDAAHSMSSNTLIKMIAKYCPRNEIKKLEMKIWELKVKGTDVTSYTQRFQELALMCGRMFSEESDKIEKYVGGLPDMIHGSVIASKPKIMQDEVEFATKLMDKKIRTFAERQTKNKRKSEDNSRNNKNQQQNKRQNSGRAYTVGSGQKTTCFECGAHGHFKRELPKLKNNNRGNQSGNGNAPTKVYVVGNVGTNPDSNAVTSTFLPNNRYASILFDTGADRRFMSTAFSSKTIVTPTTLDHYYDVKLADGRIVGLNTII